MEKRQVTQNDVAREAGVTRSMVSYVINGTEGRSVAPETRQRILEVIDRLGYRPNKAAQALNQGDIAFASKRIGVEREFLINPSGNVKITIKNDLINVEVLFKDEGKNELLILNTSSETYIPNIETKFALV